VIGVECISKAQAAKLQTYWHKTEFNANVDSTVFGISGNAVEH